MQQRTDDLDLPILLGRVFRARRAMDRVRRSSPHQRTDADLARHELIEALEAYLSGLDACHSPVPYRLLNELRLNRGLENRS